MLMRDQILIQVGKYNHKYNKILDYMFVQLESSLFIKMKLKN